MNLNNSKPISRDASVILDSLRLSSSLTVLLIHSRDIWFPSQEISPEKQGHINHAAVVVFFVLSGYVIAYTTKSNNRGMTQYAQARLSRLYSIVLPALVVTALVQFTIWRINPILALQYTRGAELPRFLLSGTFLNEIWFFSAAPPINGPLWSLSYEFWYYVIFGLYFFCVKGWKSLLLPLVACLVAGPKILLLMPIWLAGLMAYSLPKPNISPIKSWLLLIFSFSLLGLSVAYLYPYPYPLGVHPFTFANMFVTDWVCGFFIALGLWFLPAGSRSVFKPSFVKWFRKIADLTFPIYVLHYPLLILYKAICGYRENNNMQRYEAFISVLIVTAIIGFFLESKRFLWSRFFKWLLSYVKPLTNGYTRPKLNS